MNRFHLIEATKAAAANNTIRTLAVAASEASLLQAVVVVPAPVLVHLHAALLGHVPGVEGRVGLVGSPVEEAQRRPVRPGPAN